MVNLKTILRHLTSFALPIIVLIIVPILIEKNFTISLDIIHFMGTIVIFAGLVLMILTIRMFIMIGKGTLPPWDPTKKLITRNLYGYVRNPMILGVLIVLIGESLLFVSFRIVIWAMLFFLMNTIYFILSEEPGLEKRFGKEYVEYKKNVPRWVPRVKPWATAEELKKK